MKTIGVVLLFLVAFYPANVGTQSVCSADEVAKAQRYQELRSAVTNANARAQDNQTNRGKVKGNDRDSALGRFLLNNDTTARGQAAANLQSEADANWNAISSPCQQEILGQ